MLTCYTPEGPSCAVFDPAGFNAIVSACVSAEGGLQQLWLSAADATSRLATIKGGPAVRLAYALGHIFILTATHFHRIKVAGGAAAALPISEEHPGPVSTTAFVGVQKDVFMIGMFGQPNPLLLRYNVPSQELSVVCEIPSAMLTEGEAATAQLAADYAGTNLYIVKNNGSIIKVDNITSEGNGKCTLETGADGIGAGVGPAIFIGNVDGKGLILRQRHGRPGLARYILESKTWDEADNVAVAAAGYDLPMAYDRKNKVFYYLEPGMKTEKWLEIQY